MTGARVGVGARRPNGPFLRRVLPRSPWAAVMAAWHLHRDLLSNAGSLVMSTGVASLLGVVYWMFATRLFSQRAVGYGSAAVSAMTLLGTIGMLGLGTLLIGELPRRTGRAGLVSAALLTCGLGSLVLGLVFAVVAPHVSVNFANMIGTPGRGALFVAGVAVTGVTLVFDQATIGLMRGGLQLGRNIAFAVAKVLVLPAAAIVLHDQFGAGITATWVAGMALSLVLVAIRLGVAGEPVLPRPDWGVLRGLGKTAMAHNWLNLAMTMPFYLLPVLVTVIVSPSANAAFYIAAMLTTFLFIVPAHLSTVLFAVVAADPRRGRQEAAFRLAAVVPHRNSRNGCPHPGGASGARPVREGLHGGHGTDVADNPRLPGGGSEVSVHRGVPGGRPDNPCGDCPYRLLEPGDRRRGGRRDGRRAVRAVAGAAGGTVRRGTGDHPAGAPHRLRPKPAPRHRLYLPTLMANDSVASPPPPCHISKPAWTFRR